MVCYVINIYEMNSYFYTHQLQFIIIFLLEPNFKSAGYPDSTATGKNEISYFKSVIIIIM